MIKVLIFFISIIQIAYGFPLTPDKTKTYGTYCTTKDKDFKEFRYKEQIPYCNRNVDSNTKNYIYNSYSIPKEDRKEYTIDHLIPLALGGNNNVHNLWPEHISLRDSRIDPTTGIKLEFLYFEKMRAGTITQKEAIDKILKSKFNEGTNE